MPRPRKPSRDFGIRSFARSSFSFSEDDRTSLNDLTKLNNERFLNFVRDIEQDVDNYHAWKDSRKKRPSPASQKVLFAEIGKAATRLQQLLSFMHPDARYMYHQSAPFPYEKVLENHRITMEHIIHLALRADKTLSLRARPGRPKNTALDDLFLCLRFTVRKYVPSLGRQTFGELVQFICASAGINIPDVNDSPSRFWALIDPPFIVER